MENDPYKQWEKACKFAVDCVNEASFEEASDVAIEMAYHLLATAHNLKGVGCPVCGGAGEKAYGSTATWRGGIGGQMITFDVCDKCWGTGRTDKTGPNLKKLWNK